MNKLMQNEDCTYLYDPSKRLLYISLSFEDLTDLDNCEDWFSVNVDDYDMECEPIADLVNWCKSMDEREAKLESIRNMYGSEIDESTGQEIVGGNICIEDVDWLL